MRCDTNPEAQEPPPDFRLGSITKDMSAQLHSATASRFDGKNVASFGNHRFAKRHPIGAA
jgi:hypothetical protein